MLGDAIAAKKASGEAPESLEIVDVAQLLARSVRPAQPQPTVQPQDAQPQDVPPPGEQPQPAAQPQDAQPPDAPPPDAQPPAGG
jgi:hypothetical protein